jgi:hypothetical protein
MSDAEASAIRAPAKCGKDFFQFLIGTVSHDIAKSQHLVFDGEEMADVLWRIFLEAERGAKRPVYHQLPRQP